MQNRKLAHRSFVTRPLGLERLQERSMLAGNVSAFVDRGTLIVNGDIGDNELRITQVAPNWVQLTTMSSPTTINSNLSTATFKVTKGMIFNMGGGNDVLQFDGITMRQKNDLVVDMGIGDDNLQFNNMKVLRIRAVLGEGHDSATVTNSKVERSLNIFGAGGDDQITLANSKFGEKSVVDGNGGANFINQSNVKFGRKLQSLNMTFGTRPPITPSQLLTAGTDAETATEGQQNALFNVLENDIPTTGASLVITSLDITDGPDHGTADFNPDGTLVYTHNGTNNLTDTIKYTIKDSSGATATGTVNITITAVNDKPTGQADSKSVANGKSIRFTVTGNDSDEEGQLDLDSTAIGTSPTNGTAVVNSDGSITYTHNGTATTTDTFTYTIKDNSGLASDPITVNITVVANNTGPTGGADSQTVTEGGNATINVLSNDTDSDGIDASSVVIVQAAANGNAVVNANGTITYTHNGSETTTDTFTYRVKDNLGTESSPITVTITVTPQNDAPTAVADSANATRNAQTIINVASNDTDPEGQLSLTTIVIVSNPTHGTAVANNDGTVTYTNNGNAAATDSFTYNIKDSTGAVSNTVTVTLNIANSGNQAPVAANDSQTVAEGAAATITVLSNDDDPDGDLDADTVVIVTQPANGTAVPQANGTIIYTHNGSETTTDTFTYTVKDNQGQVSNTATVTITITPANDAPTAVADTANATRNAQTIINVASNDTDPEGQLALNTIVIVSNPSHGAAVANNDGTVTYTNNGNAATTDSFTYTIKDSTGATSNTVTVTLNVSNEGNQAPVAGNDSQTVAEGAGATITVLSNDDDPDGDLDVDTVVIVAQPANGTAVAQPNGTIIYTHNGSETTTDTFTYTVKDNQGQVSNTATVTITITPQNDAPVAVADAANVANGGLTTFSVSSNDTDAENALDLTEVTIVAQPTNGTVVENNDGTVTYTHNGSATTSDSFTYNVKDQSGAVSNTITVTITIGAETNDPPIAGADSANVDEGDDVVINVASNDSDPENDLDLGSIVQVQAPAHGTLTVNGDGTVTYTHDGSETTSDSFTYTISDGDGEVSNAATVTITIAPLNDLPTAVEDSDTVNEGDDVIVDVSANDTDADGTIDLASIAIVDQGVNGTAVANSDGTITYTHNGSETTSDTFTYTIADNTGAVSNIVTVTITIDPVNDAPVANGDVADVDEGASVTIPVATNDDDPEDDLDLTSIVITQNPNHGTLTDNGDGTITYEHDGSESISDTFSYTIKDADGVVSGTAQVTITIDPVNDAPVAVDEGISVTEDSGVNGTGDVLTNDSDPENDALSVTAVDGLLGNVGIDVAGQFGTFHINSDGSFTYDLDDTNTTVDDLDDLDELIDSIAYTISDGNLTSTATLSVTIAGNTD